MISTSIKTILEFYATGGNDSGDSWFNGFIHNSVSLNLSFILQNTPYFLLRYFF